MERKEYFYYLRSDPMLNRKTGKLEIGKPIITICLIVDKSDGDLEIYKGVALCSEKDEPCKGTGRDKAMGRAMQVAFKRAVREIPISKDLGILTFDPITSQNAFSVISRVGKEHSDEVKKIMKYGKSVLIGSESIDKALTKREKKMIKYYQIKYS
jgi:hypothetical protein